MESLRIPLCWPPARLRPILPSPQVPPLPGLASTSCPGPVTLAVQQGLSCSDPRPSSGSETGVQQISETGSGLCRLTQRMGYTHSAGNLSVCPAPNR
ncbi:hypothetical protein CapIbe_017927 [Capra ibex]